MGFGTSSVCLACCTIGVIPVISSQPVPVQSSRTTLDGSAWLVFTYMMKRMLLADRLSPLPLLSSCLLWHSGSRGGLGSFNNVLQSPSVRVPHLNDARPCLSGGICAQVY